MSNKNAYEIRLDILSIAHSDMQSQFHEKLELNRQKAIDTSTTLEPKLVDELYPTTNQIIERAKEFDKYVSGTI
jgi:hypothetical protein